MHLISLLALSHPRLLQTLHKLLRWESITLNKATLVFAVLNEMMPGVVVMQQVPVTYNIRHTYSCMPHHDLQTCYILIKESTSIYPPPPPPMILTHHSLAA